MNLTWDELQLNHDKARQNLLTVFEEIHVEVDNRKAILLAQLEEYHHVKDKELLLQRDDLEIVNEGIISSTIFADRLMAARHDIEVILSEKAVIERLNNLCDMPIALNPIHNGRLDFNATHQRKELLDILSQFGMIDPHLPIPVRPQKVKPIIFFI